MIQRFTADRVTRTLRDVFESVGPVLPRVLKTVASGDNCGHASLDRVVLLSAETLCEISGNLVQAHRRAYLTLLPSGDLHRSDFRPNPALTGHKLSGLRLRLSGCLVLPSAW